MGCIPGLRARPVCWWREGVQALWGAVFLLPGLGWDKVSVATGKPVALGCGSEVPIPPVWQAVMPRMVIITRIVVRPVFMVARLHRVIHARRCGFFGFQAAEHRGQGDEQPHDDEEQSNAPPDTAACDAPQRIYPPGAVGSHQGLKDPVSQRPGGDQRQRANDGGDETADSKNTRPWISGATSPARSPGWNPGQWAAEEHKTGRADQVGVSAQPYLADGNAKGE